MIPCKHLYRKVLIVLYLSAQLLAALLLVWAGVLYLYYSDRVKPSQGERIRRMAVFPSAAVLIILAIDVLGAKTPYATPLVEVILRSVSWGFFIYCLALVWLKNRAITRTDLITIDALLVSISVLFILSRALTTL